jgi:Na+/proline symporter
MTVIILLFFIFLLIFFLGIVLFVLNMFLSIKDDNINKGMKFALVGWMFALLGGGGAFVSGIIWIVEKFAH